MVTIMAMSPQFLVFNSEVQKSLKTQGFFINLVPKFIGSKPNLYLFYLE